LYSAPIAANFLFLRSKFRNAAQDFFPISRIAGNGFPFGHNNQLHRAGYMSAFFFFLIFIEIDSYTYKITYNRHKEKTKVDEPGKIYVKGKLIFIFA